MHFLHSLERPLKRLTRALENSVGRTRQRLNAAQALRQLRALLGRLPANPFSTAVYSWVLPLNASQLSAARQTLQSLRNQLSGRWEVVLVPYGPCPPACDDLLRNAAEVQVKLLPPDPARDEVQAYVEGTHATRGEWIGYLSPESRLVPEALLWLDLAIMDHPEARWLYSDERFREGRQQQANFKPDFSVEHLWSQPFTGQLSIYSKPLLDRLGLPTTEFGPAWQHDLSLRLAEVCRPEQIRHLPVLLHETVLQPGQLESWLRLTPEHHAATRAALARRGVEAELLSAPGARNLPRIQLRPRRRPRVAVVIATRDHAELVIPCVTSLRENTRYPDYEVIVIDNQSQEPQLLDYLATESAQGRLRVHRYDQPFDHSDMHNQVLRTLEADHAILVNNDVYGFSSGWLEELVATAELDERIAVVGAQLFYPDDTVQHAGVFLGQRMGAAHCHRDCHRETDGYFGRLAALQEYSAVTAALQLIRRRAFGEVGGFDSACFPTSFNDVDLCLRLRQAGYRCLYNPSVQAYHLESKTRGSSPREREFRQTFQSRWAAQLANDPFYNRSLPRKQLLLEDWSVCSSRELLRTAESRLGRSARAAAWGAVAAGAEVIG
jgi:O-antigen biosynthesis protein